MGGRIVPHLLNKVFRQIKHVMVHFKVNVTALLHLNTGIDSLNHVDDKKNMIMRISEYPIVDSEMHITVFTLFFM